MGRADRSLALVLMGKRCRGNRKTGSHRARGWHSRLPEHLRLVDVDAACLQGPGLPDPGRWVYWAPSRVMFWLLLVMVTFGEAAYR